HRHGPVQASPGQRRDASAPLRGSVHKALSTTSPAAEAPFALAPAIAHVIVAECKRCPSEIHDPRRVRSRARRHPESSPPSRLCRRHGTRSGGIVVAFCPRPYPANRHTRPPLPARERDLWRWPRPERPLCAASCTASAPLFLARALGVGAGGAGVRLPCSRAHLERRVHLSVPRRVAARRPEPRHHSAPRIGSLAAAGPCPRRDLGRRAKSLRTVVPFHRGGRGMDRRK